MKFIPPAFLEKCRLRPMDILSDIRVDSMNMEVRDTVPVPVLSVPPLKILACPDSITCFEDFSSEQNGMDFFFKGLHSKRHARIAFFGDSFIEGDIFSGDLRDKLQEEFGGKGVGMLPLSSSVSSFRQTIVHQYKGWKDYSLLDTSRTPFLGVSGHAFIPLDGAWVTYSVPKGRTLSDSCTKVSIFYRLESHPANVYYKINDQESEHYPLLISEQIERMDILHDKIGKVSFSFPETESLTVYGISMEDTSGIILDNFSVRGTAGTAFGKMYPTLPRFDQLLEYDLIILEYGLNIMEAEKTGYKGYEEGMVKTIQHLKSCFPNASFLLLSVSDRSMRKNGNYVTMPAVPAMVALQKRICAQTGIVFWNMFEAMGGNGSMVDWVDANPPKANKDYTHLTFTGGKYLGNLLYKAFEFENIRYNEKNNHFRTDYTNQPVYSVDSTNIGVRQ